MERYAENEETQECRQQCSNAATKLKSARHAYQQYRKSYCRQKNGDELVIK